MPVEQHFTVEQPQLWSPESPSLYTAESVIYRGDAEADRHTTRFGIRTVELRADKGFFLNGERRKFRGVCLHHDLGPLGAAVNRSAIRRQLTLLRQMGCDAIRTSHNMPAEELVELCDEMGFMLMVEPFDEWDVAKCENGYHRFFDEWAERDMVNMLHHFRNAPSVVMWSIGNEVPTQWTAGGYKGGLVAPVDLPPRGPHASGDVRHGPVRCRGEQRFCGAVGHSRFQLQAPPLRRGLRQTAAESHPRFGDRIDGQFARGLPLPGGAGQQPAARRPPVVVLRCRALQLVEHPGRGPGDGRRPRVGGRAVRMDRFRLPRRAFALRYGRMAQPLVALRDH